MSTPARLWRPVRLNTSIPPLKSAAPPRRVRRQYPPQLRGPDRIGGSAQLAFVRLGFRLSRLPGPHQAASKGRLRPVARPSGAPFPSRACSGPAAVPASARSRSCSSWCCRRSLMSGSGGPTVAAVGSAVVTDTDGHPTVRLAVLAEVDQGTRLRCRSAGRASRLRSTLPAVLHHSGTAPSSVCSAQMILPVSV
jgi:hypothetical protein